MCAMVTDNEFICVWDAARRLGCSCRTVRRLVRRRVLYGEPLPGGKKIWLRREEVERLVHELARRHERARRAAAAVRQMWLDL